MRPARQLTVSLILALGLALGGTAVIGSLGLTAGPAAASSARTGTTVRYTIQSGDSFAGIASRFGITASVLAKANGMRLTALLVVGRTLVVPGVTLPKNLPGNLPAKLKRYPDRLQLYPVFVAAAKEAGVPSDLLMSTAYMESGWQRSIVSPDGAIGVGQLLPATAGWIARGMMHEPNLNPYVAKDNIRMSARFLRMLLDDNGWNVSLALSAYYQGPGSVSRTGVTMAAASYATVVLKARQYFR